MGALDPWRHKVHLGQIDKKGEVGAVLSQSDSKRGMDGTQTGDSSKWQDGDGKVWNLYIRFVFKSDEEFYFVII